MKTQFQRLLAAASFVAASTYSLKASPLASDDFSSYTVPTNLAGLNDGTGWNSQGYFVGSITEGFLNEVRNGSPLSYPNYVASGGNYANLAAGYGTGVIPNFFQRTVDVEEAFVAYADNDGRVGKDGTTLWGSFLYHQVAGLEMNLQGLANKPFSLPTTGSNSLFLFRINFGAGNSDTMTIWNNPNLTTWTPSATATSVSTDDYSFQTLVFIALNDTNEGRVDNIRFGTEAIDVVPFSGTATPYVTWATSNGLDPLTDGAPDFDKDKDGWSNLTEYAFFTNPNSGSSLPAMNVATGATNLTLTYLRAKAATDVTFSAESSTTLTNWSTTGVTDAPTGTENTNTAEFRATIPMDVDPKKFVRIKVLLTNP